MRWLGHVDVALGTWTQGCDSVSSDQLERLKVAVGFAWQVRATRESAAEPLLRVIASQTEAFAPYISSEQLLNSSSYTLLSSSSIRFEPNLVNAPSL